MTATAGPGRRTTSLRVVREESHIPPLGWRTVVAIWTVAVVVAAVVGAVVVGSMYGFFLLWVR